jgi:hypothetical protein
VGDGTDAVAATVLGLAVASEDADVVGDGIDVVAATVDGVAVAPVPPAVATETVKPSLAAVEIVPDAVQLALAVAELDSSGW